MSDRPARVIGIGASAGGVDALGKVVAGLPADLPHAVLIVLHLSATGRSMLPGILDRVCALPVRAAEQGEPLRRGTILVAPPDRHLLAVDGHVTLTAGPKENASRPAVDPMLRSLASAFGPAAVAVILSGALGDGSNGALAVADAGGTVLVQDPADALVTSMPERALAAVGERVHLALPAGELGRALAELPARKTNMREHAFMDMPGDPVEASRHRPEGPASGFTCPECSGALWQLREGESMRYRCRVGHAYSEDAMLVEQGTAVEAALWAALEVLEERAEMLRDMAERRARLHPRTRQRLEASAAEALERGELIRRALGDGRPHDSLVLGDADMLGGSS